jgi:hypothetical protein
MKKKYLRIRNTDLQRGHLYDLLTYPISMGHNCSIKKEKEKFGANVTLIDVEKKKLSSRIRWCLDGSSEMGAITGFSKGNYSVFNNSSADSRAVLLIQVRILRIHMFLGLPRIGYISQRYGSGSFYHQAKIVRKTLIPTFL